MDTKPTYLGLLNAIALGERNGAELFNCWSSTTTSDDVRAVLHTVALREAEHNLAFEKRLDELGYCVEEVEKEKANATHACRMAIAMSATLSDREKLEQLKFVRTNADGQDDVFDSMFHNKDLDPQTGGLLGRYIAEERDSRRLLAGCYDALCEMEHSPTAAASSTVLGDLACQVAEIRTCLSELTASVQALASRKR